MTNPNRKFLMDLGLILVSNVALYYGMKWIIRQMDPLRKTKDKSANQAKIIYKRLGLPEDQDINEYEQIIANEIIHPDDINVDFKDIGGLDAIIDDLQEAVIYPLTMPKLFKDPNHELFGPPKGVLLYGPPGVGKTMLAKAMAKESGAIFINLHVSTLTEKYFGESQKLVRAVFTLAKKLQPTIIFIDEIDAFLRERQSMDHEVTGMMKAEFMSLWDGLSSGTSDRILIVGATNRFLDIDKAILRRMPKRFEVSLPNEDQRYRILLILLKGVALSNMNKNENFDSEENRRLFCRTLAKATKNMAGSDLKELCRNAVMLPVREYLKKLKQGANFSSMDLSNADIDRTKIRSLTLKDFYDASRGSEDVLAGPIEEDIE